MKLRYLEKSIRLQLYSGKCIGCGMCAEVCPHGVFDRIDGSMAVVDRGACMECGACALNCPVSAIRAGSGVGCAYGIIGGKLRGKGDCCCG